MLTSLHRLFNLKIVLALHAVSVITLHICVHVYKQMWLKDEFDYVCLPLSFVNYKVCFHSFSLTATVLVAKWCKEMQLSCGDIFLTPSQRLHYI